MSSSVTTTVINVPIEGTENEVVDLAYTSEPLGVPAEFGFGFPRFSIGQTLGPDDRYTIKRKLGWGTHGSCWMVYDKLENNYVALKALNGHTTQLTERGIAQELRALSKVSSPPSPHCLSLLGHFKVPGVFEVDGQHLCLVTSLFGGDVATILNTLSTQPADGKADGTIPLSLSKRILLHTLRGLAHAHASGVTHTDLKSDNIFSTTRMDAPALEAWMARDPARSHPPEPSVECTVEPVVSQPLPAPSLDEARRATYVLGDFSTAHASDEPGSREISPPALRAPEIFLGGKWGRSADMWSFGVLIFEFVTNRKLFDYRENPKFGGNVIDNMLVQMACYSEEKFQADVFHQWPKAEEYFNDQGRLLLFEGFPIRIEIEPFPLERPIALYMGSVMSTEEIMAMKNVMRRCLRLDPTKRVTAQELLEDPWWQSVE